MPYSLRVKHLEESYRVLCVKIETLENKEPDSEGLTKLYEHKESLYKDLVKMRRAQHEAGDYVEQDDDR